MHEDNWTDQQSLVEALLRINAGCDTPIIYITREHCGVYGQSTHSILSSTYSYLVWFSKVNSEKALLGWSQMLVRLLEVNGEEEYTFGYSTWLMFSPETINIGLFYLTLFSSVAAENDHGTRAYGRRRQVLFVVHRVPLPSDLDRGLITVQPWFLSVFIVEVMFF